MYQKLLILIILLSPQICLGAVYRVGQGEKYPTFADFHAAVTPTAGDVVDGGGQTFFEEIVVSGSGKAGHPITYQNFKVVGASILASWSGPVGNAEFSIAIPKDVMSGNDVDIFIKDGVIVNRAADNAQGALRAGYWTKNTASKRIYYKPDDGMAHIFEAGRGNLVRIDGHDYINVKNCSIYGGTNGVRSNTTKVDKVYGLEITGCTIANFYGHGVQIYSSDGTKVENNTFSYCQKGGAKMGGLIGLLSQGVTADNATVNNNRFYRNGWAHVDYDSEEHVIDVMPFSISPIITNNVITESGYLGGQTYAESLSAGTCISVDGVDNFKISDNYLSDNFNGGIVFGPDTNHAGRVGLISRNVFNHNGLAKVNDGSRSNKLRMISSKNDIGFAVDIDVSIQNNTFYNNQGNVGNFNNGAANIFLSGASELSGIAVKDNLHFNNANKADFRVYSEHSKISFTANNNLYYRNGGEDYLAIGNAATTKLFPLSNNFAAFKAAVGSVNDINVNPLFVSTSDLHLAANSPARFGGSNGGAIGAYEYADHFAPGVPVGIAIY